MSVSLKDISRVTGINTCSISWVLNRHPRALTLRPETREKILKAAACLGYCKNELAASVACRHSNLLIFISGEMGNIEYTGSIQNGILEAASERNYTIIVLRLTSISQEEILRKIIGWKAAGVIFHIPSLNTAQGIIPQLNQQHIPWGTVNLSNPGGLGITSDDAAGTYEAVKHLHATGHRHPCYLSLGTIHLEYQRKRVEGFQRGLQDFYSGCEESIFHYTDEHILSNHAPLRCFIKKIARLHIDAVLCEQDTLASAICMTAQEMHIPLPEAFSVIGFGNSLIAPHVYPPLTTISQNFEEMGRYATASIIDFIEEKSPLQTINMMQPVQLIHRKSVQPRS